MRFTKADNKENDTRTVVRFAYIPVRITNTNTFMWLEKFYSTEKLIEVGIEEGLTTLEWVRIEANPVNIKD